MSGSATASPAGRVLPLEGGVIAPGGPGGRLISIDVLRGLVILAMIFVNDVAGVRDVPAWMKHIEPPEADGMTFVDVIFPAFLVIVGISIPFALERRLACEPPLRVLVHIVTRTLGLLVIGVFMVNAGLAAATGPLHPELWTLLMYAGVVLVWLAPPRRSGLSARTRVGLRLAGILLLAAMAVLYRGPGERELIELRPHWWGILGLIGWAYLVASAAYLAFRARVAGLIGAVVLLYLVYLADAMGYFSVPAGPAAWVKVGPMLGSHAALTLSGALLGAVLLPGSPVRTHGERIRWAVVAGAFFAAAAHLLHAASGVHPMFIINKIAATPAWCLWSAALTFWLWAAVYWVLDVQRLRGWAAMLEAAGQNALLAYVLAPIAYSAIALTALALSVPNAYAQLGGSFATGFARSVLFALVIVGAAAALRRSGFVLRL